MLLLTINELSKFIEDSSIKLFKMIDEELVPDVFLVSFDLSNQSIHIRFQNELIALPSAIESIEELFNKKLLLSELINNHVAHAKRETIKVNHSDFFMIDDKIFTYILLFDLKVMETYYQIPSSAEIKVKSIIDAIIMELIASINKAINGLINNQNIINLSSNELMRRAGKRLLGAILGDNITANPFEKINKISSLSYEKTFSSGKILLLNEQFYQRIEKSPNFKLHITLLESLPLSSFRHIRKILELSGNDVYLLSDGEQLYSTVTLKTPIAMSEVADHIFTIEFNNYYAWQLNHNGNKLMTVSHEEVYIPKPKVSYFNFSNEFKKIFPDSETKNMLHLYKLILESLKQVKGTIIVISKNAKSEAYRLKNQCFRIEGTYLTPSMMKSITSIDGAVLIDLDGICHGIGVILDGIATNKGDPSRGARYNSAIRYVETISNNQNYSDCFTVVISEDGDVDMISKHTL